jgi:hypothetical protein
MLVAQLQTDYGVAVIGIADISATQMYNRDLI